MATLIFAKPMVVGVVFYFPMSTSYSFDISTIYRQSLFFIADELSSHGI
jgi:hypothetical protein